MSVGKMLNSVEQFLSAVSLLSLVLQLKTVSISFKSKNFGTRGMVVKGVVDYKTSRCHSKKWNIEDNRKRDDGYNITD